VASTLTDPLIGRLIDSRYLVRARIARGGMATVYLANDRRLDRDVAIKVMHPHLTEGTDVAARFRREARAAARLAHPGVVGVFDQGTDGEVSYLAMEYVDGQNLRGELARQGAFSLGDALTTIATILDALGSAHRAGLVHRDIKPENVLVSADGTLKVADFGLARAVTEATAASTGNLLGTVAYLSPEIITSGAADARADVYAVGIMLYELLCAAPPYEGESAIQVAYQHVHEDLPSIREVEPWVPAEVADLIARLCARDPQARPVDGIAAQEEVLAVASRLTEEQLSGRSEIAGSADSGDEDHTIALTGSGTTALPIGAVSGVTQALPNRLNPARKRRRRRRWALVVLVLLLLAAAGGGAWWYFAEGPGAYTAVPDVTGQTEGQAVADLSRSRLHHTIEREHSDDVPLGQVIRTDPETGSDVRYDSSVELIVSQGVLVIEVPDLEGLTEEGIRAELAEAGWDGSTLTVATEWSQEIEQGEFISSTPASGERITHSDPISVVVSAGPRPVTVRNVVGQAQEEAVAQLEEQNLAVEVAEEQVFSDSIAEGSVAAQDPAEGAEAHEGDTVTLTISKGPELFEVPSVTFKSYEDAKELLESEGFKVERKDWFGGALGTVRFQDPGPGDKHPKGTTVTLTVI